MKKYIFKISIVAIVMSMFSCEQDYLDLKPLDSVLEGAYFKTPADFIAASNGFYDKMVGLRPTNSSNVFDYMDFGSDLTAWPQDIGRGANLAQPSSVYWTNSYRYLRDVNMLLKKADGYTGSPKDIAIPVSTAYFFRAWHHFFLLQNFGGVPIADKVYDLNSPELYGKRNSRYEVMELILADLDKAIAGLPIEQNIPATDKGKISKWAAKAFKAKVLLYEATWEKYVGSKTDFEGSGTSKADLNAYLTEAITLSRDVISNGGYSLWNFNTALNNLSNWYLFNIEDAGSNPAGLTKSTNKEFIIQSIYDVTLLPGNTNVSHTVNGRMSPSRTFLDMFLCKDGLPADKSSLFQGYATTVDEFKNRDFRMLAYFGETLPSATATVKSVKLDGYSTSGPSNGLTNRKFKSYNYGTYRAANAESFNYPHLRLAEVYLILAEALIERDGSITDNDLNATINKTRARAGVEPLTNAIATVNGLNIKNEIRRERAIELFGENSRFNDLKRWGIAEVELNKPILGPVISGTEYATNATLFNSNAYTLYGQMNANTALGQRSVLVLDPAINRNFQVKNYLLPIPLNEIKLNPNLVQNPGW
jgi:hypothetical protein